MARIKIIGGNRLSGSIPISGAKNAALPLIATCLLTDEPLILTNCPDLADIETLRQVIRGHGGTADFDRGANRLELHVPHITSTTAPYELVSTMRASILVLGPLLARAHSARVALPGGCAIGSRPVDLHLTGLEQMGAQIELENGDVVAKAPGGLKGAHIEFSIVSVGATENLLMAAALANGTTVLSNAAQEPEVTDLAHCLIAMGAKIDGVGTSRLEIEGVERLNGTTHPVVADRIEAGTYAVAAGMTGGDLLLENVNLELLSAPAAVLQRAGLELTQVSGGVRAKVSSGGIVAQDISTQPFPGFPTDLQAQYMALMTLADGASVIAENIFENRFMHVPELVRMGADITATTRTATVKGVAGLTGAEVKATDLRASASLVLAGLAASGETYVDEIFHLDRGYERLEQKLSAVGANIERVT